MGCCIFIPLLLCSSIPKITVDSPLPKPFHRMYQVQLFIVEIFDQHFANLNSAYLALEEHRTLTPSISFLSLIIRTGIAKMFNLCNIIIACLIF